MKSSYSAWFTNIHLFLHFCEKQILIKIGVPVYRLSFSLSQALWLSQSFNSGREVNRVKSIQWVLASNILDISRDDIFAT